MTQLGHARLSGAYVDPGAGKADGGGVVNKVAAQPGAAEAEDPLIL